MNNSVIKDCHCNTCEICKSTTITSNRILTFDNKHVHFECIKPKITNLMFNPIDKFPFTSPIVFIKHALNKNSEANSHVEKVKDAINVYCMVNICKNLFNRDNKAHVRILSVVHKKAHQLLHNLKKYSELEIHKQLTFEIHEYFAFYEAFSAKSLLGDADVSVDDVMMTIWEKEKPTTTEIEEEKPTTTEIEEEKPTTTEIEEEKPTTTEIEEEKPTTTEIEEEMPTTTEIEEEKPTTTEIEEEMPTTTEIEEEKPTTTTEIEEEMPTTTEIEEETGFFSFKNLLKTIWWW
jgi:hypothetical protein